MQLCDARVPVQANPLKVGVQVEHRGECSGRAAVAKSHAGRSSRPAHPTYSPGLLLDRRQHGGEHAQDSRVFGNQDRTPFHAASLYRRADRAWSKAGLCERLRLHQARHTYASFMIAAGVNAKALSVFMGHSSIKVTFDLYGHLIPGAEAEAAALLDRFLGA